MDGPQVVMNDDDDLRAQNNHTIKSKQLQTAMLRAQRIPLLR